MYEILCFISILTNITTVYLYRITNYGIILVRISKIEDLIVLTLP